MSITAPISDHAHRHPDAVALTFGTRRASWRELDAAIVALSTLIAERVPPEGGVALDVPNGFAAAVLFLAIAAAGRTALVLEPDWPAEMVRGVLERLQPEMTITARIDLGADARTVSPDLAVGEVAAVLGFSGAGTRQPEPDPAAIFYTGFTSGSTAQPKGFRRSHGSWTASFAGAQTEFRTGAGDVVLALGPFSHSTTVYALADALHAGASVVILRGFQARSVLRTIVEQGVSVIYGVPAHLMMLIEAAEAAGLPPLAGVRLVIPNGAKWPEALSGRLRNLFPAALIVEFYGASELSFVTRARGDEAVPAGSVGRAFPGVTISVRDRRGRRLAAGKTGIVFVESALTFAGYALGGGDVIRAGDALSVGDRGFLDAGGFLHLTGRVDRMVISSGRNVQPESVERVLGTHPAVAEAAVIGVPDAHRGARLLALVVLRPGLHTNRANLVRHLRESLPAYMVPRQFGCPPEWPRTRSGKSDVKRLARMWADGMCGVLE